MLLILPYTVFFGRGECKWIVMEFFSQSTLYMKTVETDCFVLCLSSSSSSSSFPSRPQHYTDGPVPLLPGASHPRRQAVRLRPGLSARRRRGRPLPWVHRDIRARNAPRPSRLCVCLDPTHPPQKTQRPSQPYWFAFNEAAASGPMGAAPARVLPKSYAWLAFLTLDMFDCCYFSPLSACCVVGFFFQSLCEERPA